MSMNTKLMARATVTFMVFLAIIGIAYAGYWVYSEWSSISVSDYELTLSPTSETVNKTDVITFTAHLTKDGVDVEGARIYFYKEGTEFHLDTRVTNSTGQCVFYYEVVEAEGTTTRFRAGYEVV